MEDIKEKIIDFYKNYNINFEIYDIKPSYAVTRYFIKLDRATKNKLANVEKLTDDLSIELGIKNIDFKNNFFEIPNETKKTLKINELDYIMPEKDRGLYVPFGKDLNNNNYIVDLCETPHLLVAGTTGSRKECIFKYYIVDTNKKL